MQPELPAKPEPLVRPVLLEQLAPPAKRELLAKPELLVQPELLA